MISIFHLAYRYRALGSKAPSPALAAEQWLPAFEHIAEAPVFASGSAITHAAR